MKLLPLYAAAVLGASPSAHAATKRILHFSDVHLNISTDSSTAMPFRYGADATIAMLESALAYAKRVLPNPDFLLYTGDHAAHGQVSDDFVKHAVETNVKTFEKYFPPDPQTRLEATAIIGNADGNPDYYMDVTDPDQVKNPSIELISQVWSGSLSPSNFDSLNRRGYLAYDLDAKLAVLTLNTVPYSPSHLPDTSANQDPFNQFAWLNATLLELRQKSRFAYIAGHIAPFIDSYGGQPQWHEHYIQTYKAIVSSYCDVIKAQFFGHVHSVEFRVPVDSTGVDSLSQVPLFVSGSVSPLFGNNPSFMVWEYDADTYEVMDFTVHGTNISESDQQLAWRPLFKARDAYDLQSLSSTALKDLYERMQADPSLLEEYYWNMKAQSYRLPPCDNADCRAKTLCTLKWWGSRGEYLACVNSALSSYSVMARTGAMSGTSLPASEVAVAIVGTVVASAAVIAVVLVVMRVLKNSGVLKTPDERVRDYDNVFPML